MFIDFFNKQAELIFDLAHNCRDFMEGPAFDTTENAAQKLVLMSFLSSGLGAFIQTITGNFEEGKKEVALFEETVYTISMHNRMHEEADSQDRAESNIDWDKIFRERPDDD